MPSTGTPSSNTTLGARGVSSSVTEPGRRIRITPRGLKSSDELFADIVRMQFAIHAAFAHTARDQLRVLRAEIEDEDFFMSFG